MLDLKATGVISRSIWEGGLAGRESGDRFHAREKRHGSLPLSFEPRSEGDEGDLC